MQILFSSDTPNVLQVRERAGDAHALAVLTWAQRVATAPDSTLLALVPEGCTHLKTFCDLTVQNAQHPNSNSHVEFALLHETAGGNRCCVTLAFTLPTLARRDGYQDVLNLALEVYAKHCAPLFAPSWEKWNAKIPGAHGYGVDTNFTLHADHYTQDGVYDRTLIEKLRQVALSQEAGVIRVRAKWGYDPDHMSQPEETVVLRFSKPAHYESL